ncbi:MAG: AAA family ATPase [Xanthomonadales bacterium]|jgi:general secretion pathway protein A|nr:AAA family ATPase [Xanthomonadales bacterium]
MYLDHFGLKEAPFAITPDPRFVWLSERHRDGLAHLLYGVGQGGAGGFVLLTGEIGTGKTTLSRLLLEQLPERTQVALILNPRLSAFDLVEAIAEEFGIDLDGRRGSLKAMTDALNAWLLSRHAEGWHCCVMIDEAQQLSMDALEQVRLLTNLETATQKLLQVILLGQPELKDILAQPELKQLAQRITARYHLTALDADEVADYVRHRLAVAGAHREILLPRALASIAKASEGVPRLINVLADRALLAAYVAGSYTVDAGMVRSAIREAQVPPSASRRVTGLAVAILTLLLLPLAAWRYWPTAPAPVPAVPAPMVSAAPLAPALADWQEVADALAQDPDGAARALIRAWGVEAAPALLERLARCPRRLSAELRCLQAAGNLQRLQRLRVPVLLSLPGAGSQHILWRGGADPVRLEVGKQSFLVAAAALEQHWLGEFVAIYRMPEQQLVVEGSAAERARLAALLGRALGEPVSVAVPALREALQRFQQTHGLDPDGVVGPWTVLALVGYLEGAPAMADAIRTGGLQ